MPNTPNFPPKGETRKFYCNDCHRVVDWEITEKYGEFYWHTYSCGKTVKIGTWPEKEYISDLSDQKSLKEASQLFHSAKPKPKNK